MAVVRVPRCARCRRHRAACRTDGAGSTSFQAAPPLRRPGGAVCRAQRGRDSATSKADAEHCRVDFEWRDVFSPGHALAAYQAVPLVPFRSAIEHRSPGATLFVWRAAIEPRSRRASGHRCWFSTSRTATERRWFVCRTARRPALTTSTSALGSFASSPTTLDARSTGSGLATPMRTAASTPSCASTETETRSEGFHSSTVLNPGPARLHAAGFESSRLPM